MSRSSSPDRCQRSRRPHWILTTAVITAVATLLVGSPMAAAAQPTFNDVPADHPFFDEIEWMVSEGITTGYNDGTFRPAASITRQAMAAFFYRFSGSPAFTPPTTPQFSDVPRTHPFFKEIEWMVSAGITTGYSDGTFRPAATITRQAQAAFFYRVAGKPTVTLPGAPSFTDVGAAHPFFKEIEWLSSSHITGGYPDGTFRPTGNITRQAAAAFFSRFDDLFATTVPGAPTAVAAAPGSGQAMVSWTPPASDGGAALTDYRVTATPGGGTVQVAATTTTATIAGLTNGQSYTFTVAAKNSVGFGPESVPSVPVVPASDDLQPPPLDPTVEPSLYESTRFLYTEPGAVQKGVAPSTITRPGAAAVAGRVLDISNLPVTGARVEIIDGDEFGRTATRSQGEWNLVVNAGGAMLVRISADGYLPVQRWITPVAGEWIHADDVVLTRLDADVTTVDVDATTDQVVQGSEVTDADGDRQATLIVPKGTGAQMVMADGSTEPLDQMDIRATEYTVGDNGPAAMPGILPTTSGYTYAVEFSVDEALEAGATSVEFDQPMVNYTENFVGFPVGSPVPTGWYDADAGEWVPSPNGVVIAIVSEAAGLANVDITGDGNANTPSELAAMGIDAAERGHLATLYGPGAELWRVEIAHFTPWDHNWPYGCASTCAYPNPGNPTGPNDGGDGDDDCQTGGSVINCQEQTLGERVPLTGVPFGLVYESDRVPGRADSRSLDIPLVGPSGAGGATEVEVTIDIAGQRHTSRHTPTPGTEMAFTWDGRDAFGRATGAKATATIQVTYVYPAVYKEPAEFAMSFAQPSTGANLEANRAAGQIRASSVSQVELSGLDLAGMGFGGWTVEPLHRLDRASNSLHLGTGTTRALPDRLLGSLMTPMAGTGAACDGGPCGDGGNAIDASLRTDQVVAAPDGSLYLHDDSARRIRRIAPDGTITTVAGNGTVCAANATTGCGTGGQATSASLSGTVVDLAVAPSGTLYLLEDEGNIVRAVSPDGVITHVAGTGSDCLASDPGYPRCGTGGPAVAAPIEALSIDVVNNQLTVVETLTSRDPVIRAVNSSGTMTNLYGCADWSSPTCVDATDGALATAARISPILVTATSDNAISFVEGHAIRRIDPNGVLSTVAGGRDCTGSTDCGDGGSPLTAGIHAATALAPDLGNGLLLLDRYDNLGYVVRRILPGNTIVRVAGGGQSACTAYPAEPCGDDAPASLATIVRPTCCSAFSWSPMAVTTDGMLHITDSGVLRSVDRSASLPDGSFGVASTNGQQIYVFDERGRHMRTDDAMSGLTEWSFTYDGDGRAVAVTDRLGNVTTIERSADGNATAIIGPFGSRTTMSTGPDGYLATIANPAGEVSTYTYANSGLMASYQEPSGDTSTFTYDTGGRLIRDENAVGGFTQLALAEIPGGRRVTTTTGMGQTKVYETVDGPLASTTHQYVDPAGAVTTTINRPDGSTSTTYPDGRTLAITYVPDPRFAMDSPSVDTLVETTPGGLTRTRSYDRRTELVDPADPLTLTNQTDSVRDNGAPPRTVTYVRSTNTQTVTSPEGRVSTTVYGPTGLPMSFDPGYGLPATYSYDTHGLTTKVAMGNRASTMTYNAAGRLTTEADADGNTATYAYDAAGRRTSLQLPTGGVYAFGYDIDGNQTTVTVPGGGVHTMIYDATNASIGYTPPSRPSSSVQRDLDRRIVTQTNGAGASSSWTYGGDGRLTSIAGPQATSTVAFADATTRMASMTQTPAAGAPGIAASTSFAWDGPFRTSLTSNAASSATVASTFDDRFRPTGTTTTVGGQVTALPYQWDDDGLLTDLGDYAVTREPTAGLLTTMTDGSAEFGHTWDPSFADETSSTLTVSGTPTFSETLVRDRTGTITQSTTVSPSGTSERNYTYDASDRLVSVSGAGAPAETYAWDARGNLVTGPGGTATFAADDQPVTAGGEAITHDANGQRTSRPGATYEWSSRGDLLRAVVDGNEVTYSYGMTGLRVARTDSGGTTHYVYGDQAFSTRVSAIIQPDGTLIALTYDELGRLVSYATGGQTYYVGADHLGTPRVIADTSGAVLLDQQLDAFGNVISSTGPGVDLPIGFAGGVVDPVTGFIRFGLRDYDPVTGVWVMRDPARFGGGLNHYAYVGGNPVNRTDPSGLFGFPGFDLADIDLPDFPEFKLCAGGSAYAGLGGGGEVCIGSGGVSVCAEVGFGIGADIGAGPQTGGVGGNSAGAGAKASIGCGPVSAEIGVKATVTSCGSSVEAGFEIGAGPVSVGASASANSDGTSDVSASAGYSKSASTGHDFKGGCSAQAKLTADFCLGTGSG